MVIRKLFQSRFFWFLFGLIPLILSIYYYYSKFYSLNYNLIVKVLEINDREPTYKLATYEGYQFPVDRNRAQTELFNYLKLQQRCKLNPNTTVIDVGASLGEFGFYAAACGCQVYMFEIEPKKIFLIKKSIQLNSFESHVYFIKKAVSDLKSKSTIYFSKNTSSQLSQSMNIRRNKPDIFRGETVNLNEYPFPSSLSIFILRVDVQGHELHVFRSAEKLFHEHRVHHVIFEYTPWGTPTPVQKEIFGYMKTILGAKKFYALHPKQPIIYGPLNDVDMNEFYSQHNKQQLQRDVYALFKDEESPITSNAYSFQTSF